MQMNLPTRPTQGPMRGVPAHRGSDAGSMARRRSQRCRQQRLAGDVGDDAGQIADRAVCVEKPGLRGQKGRSGEVSWFVSFQFPAASFQFQLPVGRSRVRQTCQQLAAGSRESSMRLPRDLVTAAADEEIEIGALVGLLHVLDVERAYPPGGRSAPACARLRGATRAPRR